MSLGFKKRYSCFVALSNIHSSSVWMASTPFKRNPAAQSTKGFFQHWPLILNNNIHTNPNLQLTAAEIRLDQRQTILDLKLIIQKINNPLVIAASRKASNSANLGALHPSLFFNKRKEKTKVCSKSDSLDLDPRLLASVPMKLKFSLLPSKGLEDCFVAV